MIYLQLKSLCISRCKNFLYTLSTIPAFIKGSKKAGCSFKTALAHRNARLFRRLKKKPYVFKLVSKTRLDPLDASHASYELEFLVTGNIHWVPGDLLYLYWKNDPALVDAMLSRFGRSGDEIIYINSFTAGFLPGRIRRCSLRQACTEIVDLNFASSALLEKFGYSDIAAHNTRQQIVQREMYARALYGSGEDGAPDNPDFFTVWLEDLLESCKKRISLNDILNLQERISPRSYSISSIQTTATSPGEYSVKITVSQLDLSTIDLAENHVGRKTDVVPQIHPARCAGYLCRIKSKQSCLGWILPETQIVPPLIQPSKPVIFICTGSAVSLLLAMLEGCKTVSQLWVIYGVRNWDNKSLYADQLKAYEKTGKINRLDSVVSRPAPDSGIKAMHVQDYVQNHSAEIYEWIKKDAMIFVTGRLTMGIDVCRSFRQVLIKEQGLEPDEASKRIAAWKRDLRFQSAVSGI